MTSIYKQADRDNQNKTFERMQLISMIPLEVGNPSSKIFPPSPLEVKRNCFKNTISSFTKNIDCKVNIDGLDKKVPDWLDNQSTLKFKDGKNSHFEHRKTPYKPSFKQKRHTNPGVGAYSPQYDAILPRSIQITMKDKNSNNENTKLEKNSRNRYRKNTAKKKVKVKKPLSPSNEHENFFSEDKQLENEYDYQYEYEYDDCYSVSQNHRAEQQFDAYSTSEILSKYQSNMRDFDENSINYPKFESLDDANEPETIKYNAYKESLKGESLCFRHDGYRTIFENNSPAKHIEPADPIPLPQPPVPILSRQKNRELSLLDRLKYYNETAENTNIAGKKADDGTYKHFNMHNSKVADLALSLSRNYPDAVSQLDKLKPRTPSLPRIKYQTPRFGSPPKNKRVEFLDRLTKEQTKTIKTLSKSQLCEDATQTKLKKSAKSPANQTKPRPKSAFDYQSSRPKCVFPGHSESPFESKYPSNPIESYKKTIPQIKAIKIPEGGSRELRWHPS